MTSVPEACRFVPRLGVHVNSSGISATNVPVRTAHKPPQSPGCGATRRRPGEDFSSGGDSFAGRPNARAAAAPRTTVCGLPSDHDERHCDVPIPRCGRVALGKLGSAMRRIGYRVLVMCLFGASLASAQSSGSGDRPRDDWSHGTTLNGFAGVAIDSSQNGPLLGGAVGWEITPRLGIEASGSWAEFGHGTSSFAGAMKVRVRLTGRGTVDPFVQGGIGLYRAIFGPEETAMPRFYQRRVTSHMLPAGGSETFTDPTLVGGAGINIAINRHLALRPDVDAILVLRDGHRHVVTSVAIHAVYHFESHPVTPAVRR